MKNQLRRGSGETLPKIQERTRERLDTKEHARLWRMTDPFTLISDDARRRLRKRPQPSWAGPIRAVLTDDRFSNVDQSIPIARQPYVALGRVGH